MVLYNRKRERKSKKYYYDTETGFYYLQSRYYDPTLCRFISPDKYTLLSTLSMSLGELNLYSYCANNPIMYKQAETSEFGFFSLHKTSSSLSNPKLKISGSFRKGLFFGEGSIASLYTNGGIKYQIRLKSKEMNLGAFAEFSILSACGRLGVGNNYYSQSIVGGIDIGTISGMIGSFIDPDENMYFLGVQASIAAFSIYIGKNYKIGDFQIEFGVSATGLSAGVQFGAGIKDGEFYFKKGSALLWDYNFYIGVKFA
ncbi:MAG: RHS repeat-associated core domain-containing protein [Clostridia bacterium]|nr:RHS repeat-associated core domain-containing protein [Clostridia bacterium]